MCDSLGGNTEKAAERIHSTLAQGGVESEFVKVSEDTDLDLYDYDLLFLGTPVIAWGPTNTMRDFVMKKLSEHHKPGYNLRPRSGRENLP